MTNRAQKLQQLKGTENEKAQYIYAVASTYRGKGAVGERSRVVNYVLKHVVTPNDKVLDFGCGYYGTHVKFMREKGIQAYGYDLMLDEELLKLDYFYDRLPTPSWHWGVIYASNVLNVQPKIEQVEEVVSQMHSLCSQPPRLCETSLIVNYALEPRKGGFSSKTISDVLSEYFWVYEVSGELYHCYRKT